MNKNISLPATKFQFDVIRQEFYARHYDLMMDMADIANLDSITLKNRKEVKFSNKKVVYREDKTISYVKYSTVLNGAVFTLTIAGEKYTPENRLTMDVYGTMDESGTIRPSNASSTCKKYYASNQNKNKGGKLVNWIEFISLVTNEFKADARLHIKLPNGTVEKEFVKSQTLLNY